MTSLARTLSTAVSHHKAGRRTEAEAGYRKVLRSNPDHADALHLLGVLAAEEGQYEFAIAAIGRAIRLRPGNPGYFNNLGLAFSRAGDWSRAAATYRQALDMQPPSASLWNRYADALANLHHYEDAAVAYRRALELEPRRHEARLALGNALQLLRRHEEAATEYRRVLDSQPDQGEAWFQLANALHHVERYQEAVDAYQRALSSGARRPETWFNLAASLNKLDRREQALECLGEALCLKPDYAEAYNNLGATLQSLGRLAEAEAQFSAALLLRPTYLEALYNLGSALQEQDRLEEALQRYGQVVARQPGHVDSLTNRANTLLLLNRVDEALADYQAVLALEPEHAEANWNRALLWLQKGDWERGWPAYEWRFRQKEHIPKQFDRPRWMGEPLEGRTILVHAEQGLGDTIQFARFLKPLRRLGGRVIFETQPRLKTLLASTEGIDVLIARGEPRPEHDFQIELLSLPCRLGVTLPALPAEVPYLGVDEALVRHWRERMGPDGSRRIGLVWRGNTRNKVNRRRSLALEQFAPLASLAGVSFYGLLRDAPAEELAAAPFALTNLEDPSNTPSDTAAIMMNLDLVVTVDTMTAHLAGALARPVRLLLAHAADWRWMLEREDCPWYPTMRLMRQRRRGDWEELIGRLKEALSCAG